MSRRRAPHGLIFDEVPQLYDRYRPVYPPDAVASLADLAGLAQGSAVLEIGAGTGQLTRPLLERGVVVTALEPGPRLAAFLRRRLGARPGMTVIAARLEDADLAPGSFDAVVAGTSFHWVDPTRRYVLAAATLRPGGRIGLLRNDHVLSPGNEAYYHAAAAIYEGLAPELGPPYQPPPEHDLSADQGTELEASRQFELLEERRFSWDERYTATQLIGLLRTYSNHRALPRARRALLVRALSDLIDARFDGAIVDRYVTTLSVGRRIG